MSFRLICISFLIIFVKDKAKKSNGFTKRVTDLNVKEKMAKKSTKKYTEDSIEELKRQITESLSGIDKMAGGLQGFNDALNTASRLMITLASSGKLMVSSITKTVDVYKRQGDRRRPRSVAWKTDRYFPVHPPVRQVGHRQTARRLEMETHFRYGHHRRYGLYGGFVHHGTRFPHERPVYPRGSHAIYIGSQTGRPAGFGLCGDCLLYTSLPPVSRR